MSVCAPGSSDDNYTCFTHNSLKKIARAYNASHSSKIKISSSKKELWKNIQSKLKGKCPKGESCWIGLDFVTDINDIEINEYTIKPIIPPGKYKWLSTNDINAVLKQYQRLFRKKFKYLGAFPIDFAKVDSSMKRFNILKELNKGFETVGVVFNLDPKGKPGTHWIALLIDARGPIITIDFFDSYGDSPPKQVKNFIKKIRKQLNEYEVKVNINPVKHQKGTSECGMYSMLFIIYRLLGVTFDEFVRDIIKDKIVNDMRQVLFRGI